MSNQTASFLDALHSVSFYETSGSLPFILGNEENGQLVTADLERLPHLLITGTIGTGKSTLAHAIILSLIHRTPPNNLQVILCDTKIVEFGGYKNAPHLLIPVVTDQDKMHGLLMWAETESHRRLSLISAAGFRSASSYNDHLDVSEEDILPDIVILIDDAATVIDSSATADIVLSLARNGRAAGIHLILVTQSPDDKRISEIIKCAIPSRAVFNVISTSLKKQLLGSAHRQFPTAVGEMVFRHTLDSKACKVRCFPIEDATISSVISKCKANYSATSNAFEIKLGADEDEYTGDEMLTAALDIILETGQASVSMLQRRLKLGYARSARIIDEMEEKGLIGPFQGSKPREILVSKEQRASRIDLAGFKDAEIITPSETKPVMLSTPRSVRTEQPAPKKSWIRKFLDSVNWHPPQSDNNTEFERMEKESSVCQTEEDMDAFLEKHPLLEEIYTKTVGVTYDNDDGSSRQDIISRCKDGDIVLFKFYKYHGEPAAAAFTAHGQIGFLSAKLADKVENGYGCDVILSGTISEITGGADGLLFGCNLHIYVYQN